MGRPDKYTEELGEKIIDGVIIGKTIEEIFKPKSMPSEGSFYRWLHKYDSFREQYFKAKAIQDIRSFDEIKKIADDKTEDYVTRTNKKTGEQYEVVNREHIERSKLRINARMWQFGRMRSQMAENANKEIPVQPDGTVKFTLNLGNSSKLNEID